MLLFDRPRQHDDLALRRAAPARTPASSRSRRPASEAPCAAARSRPATARDAIHRRASPETPARRACPSGRLRATLRPARARARTAPGRRCERDHRAVRAHDVTARVDDERVRRQQRFDLVEQEGALLAARDQARRGRVQDQAMRFRPPPSAPGCRRRAPRSPARASASRAALVRRRRIAIPATTSSWAALDAGGRGAGSSSASVRSASSRRPIRSEPPDLEISRVRGVHAVAVLLERRPRGVERLRGPAQVARDQRDLGFGDDASRARHGLFRTEGARRAFAAEPSRGRDRRAAPSRCREARAPARSSRRATRFSAPSGSPAASARAAAVISESIGIPPHLSLPPFHVRSQSISGSRPATQLSGGRPCRIKSLRTRNG